MTTPVLMTRRGPIAELRLNRPAVRNAISPNLIDAFSRAVQEVSEDESVRAVVITGEGASFCAGADLRVLAELATRQESPREFLTRVSEGFSQLERLMKPVIAAVHGHVVAGGLELALCCDLIVAQSGTLIGDGHVRNDLLPGGGATARLARKVGEPVARWLMLSGELVPAERLLSTGFVHAVVPPAELRTEADRLATQLAGIDSATMSRMKGMIAPPADEWRHALSNEMRVLEEHWSASRVAASLRAFVERRSD